MTATDVAAAAFNIDNELTQLEAVDWSEVMGDDPTPVASVERADLLLVLAGRLQRIAYDAANAPFTFVAAVAGQMGSAE
jgi:hypothetical protein